MSNKTRYFVLVSGAILAVGLGTGLVASYMGMPVSVFSRAAGPDELKYVPADAAVVAYANVSDVMNSDFRQRFRSMEPTSNDRHDFEEKTGINIEQDIQSVVAAMMPGANMAEHPEQSALVLARGRFNADRLQALALEHGATVESYQGKSVITHQDGSDGKLAVGFIEADLVALGSDAAVRRAIDAGAGNNVMSNIEMMRLVGELDSSNAWAVGRFDALANEARLPDELQSRMPAITWFSAAGHINGGLSGVFKAEAKDEESAKNLRDVLQGFLALAKLQAGDKPGMQSMVNSLQLSGEGKTVALAFAVPTEVLDLLEAAAKASRK